MNVIIDVLSRINDGDTIDYEKIIEIPEDLSEKEQKSYKKEKINEIRTLIKDFPLFLKLDGTGLKIKRNEINSDIDKLLNRLTTYFQNDKTYYADKNRNAYSKAKFPFIEAPVENGYLNSAILNKEDKIDFVGNSANSQYYKLLARLISNDGKYLLAKYDIENYPSDFKNRIEQIEKWYKDLDKKDNEIFLDDYTAQILFPFEDSYISITPVQNMALVNKVIKTSQKLNDEYFESNKELKKQIVSLEKEITKISIKLKKELSKKQVVSNTVDLFREEIKKKKEDLKTLKEKDRLSVNIKRTSWQQMNSKTQNLSLNAPAAKNGIFLADAPNYNFEIASEVFQDIDFEKYIDKNIRNLYYMSKNFRKICDRFYELIHIYGNIEKDLNADEKEKLSSLFIKTYNYFLKAVDVKKIDDVFLEIFIKKIVDNSKKYKLTLAHTTKIFFMEKLKELNNEQN